MSNKTVAYTEEPVPNAPQEPDTSLVGFFAIGLVINLLLITAYFIWAYKQWNKRGKGDDRVPPDG